MGRREVKDGFSTITGCVHSLSCSRLAIFSIYSRSQRRAGGLKRLILVVVDRPSSLGYV